MFLKKVFFETFILVFIISFFEVKVALALLLVITLFLVRGSIPLAEFVLILRKAFWKG